MVYHDEHGKQFAKLMINHAKNGGGGGSRTPVLEWHYGDLYMLVPPLLLIVFGHCRRTGYLQTIFRIFSTSAPEPKRLKSRTLLSSLSPSVRQSKDVASIKQRGRNFRSQLLL